MFARAPRFGGNFNGFGERREQSKTTRGGKKKNNMKGASQETLREVRWWAGKGGH